MLYNLSLNLLNVTFYRLQIKKDILKKIWTLAGVLNSPPKIIHGKFSVHERILSDLNHTVSHKALTCSLQHPSRCWLLMRWQFHTDFVCCSFCCQPSVCCRKTMFSSQKIFGTRANSIWSKSHGFSQNFNVLFTALQVVVNCRWDDNSTRISCAAVFVANYQCVVARQCFFF